MVTGFVSWLTVFALVVIASELTWLSWLTAFAYLGLVLGMTPSGDDGNSQMSSPGPDVTRTDVPLISARCEDGAH